MKEPKLGALPPMGNGVQIKTNSIENALTLLCRQIGYTWREEEGAIIVEKQIQDVVYEII